MNPKLSVIVPVYNTLPYLHTCFDSIKRQKYEPMEVIIVDDGSTDGAGEFCEEYAKTDDRFCIIHKNNGGPSSARNTGIDAATGDLITFIDSDDALIGQPYSHLIDIMAENKAQIIGMRRVYSDTIPDEKKQEENDVFISTLDNIQFFCGLCNQTLSDAVWDKIFDCRLFKENRFQQGVLNEDFLLLTQLSQSSLKVLLTDYLGYFYLMRVGGITGSGFKKNMIDAVRNADYALAHMPDESCRRAAEGYLLHKILMFMINMPSDYVKEKNPEYLFARKRLKEISVLNSNRSIRDKLLLISFRIVPGSTNKLCSHYLSKRKNT